MTEVYIAIVGIIGAIVSYAIHERRRRKDIEYRQKQMEQDALERERKADEKIAEGLAKAQIILQDMTVKTFEQAAKANELLLASMARESNTQDAKNQADLKLISARRENDDLRTELDRLSEQQNILQQRVDQLTSEINLLRTSLNEKESQLVFSKQERERLTAELVQANNTIEIYEAERLIVNNRLDKLQDELNALSVANNELTARTLQLEHPTEETLAA